MRSGIQTHTGLRQEQWHTLFRTHTLAGPVRREHRFGHSTHNGRKQDTRLPWPQATEPKPKRGHEGNHRHLRTDRQGNLHVGRDIQDRTSSECFGTHRERTRISGTARMQRLRASHAQGSADKPLQRAAQGPGQGNDRTGQPDCRLAGAQIGPQGHRHLQRGMAQRCHRNRSLQTDRNLLPSRRSTYTRRRYGHRFSTLGSRF